MSLQFDRHELPGGVLADVAPLGVSQGSEYCCVFIALLLGLHFARLGKLTISTMWTLKEQARERYRTFTSSSKDLVEPCVAARHVQGVRHIATHWAAAEPPAAGSGEVTPAQAVQQGFAALGSSSGCMVVTHASHSSALHGAYRSTACGRRQPKKQLLLRKPLRLLQATAAMMRWGRDASAATVRQRRQQLS